LEGVDLIILACGVSPGCGGSGMIERGEGREGNGKWTHFLQHFPQARDLRLKLIFSNKWI